MSVTYAKINVSNFIHNLEVIKNNFYRTTLSSNFRLASTPEIELLRMEALEEVFDNSITFRLDSDKEFEKNYEGYLEVGVHYIPESKEVNLYTTGLIPGWTVIGKYESATSFPVDKLIDVKIEARYYKKDGIVYKDKPLVEITPIDNKDIEEYLDKYDFDQF